MPAYAFKITTFNIQRVVGLVDSRRDEDGWLAVWLVPAGLGCAAQCGACRCAAAWTLPRRPGPCQPAVTPGTSGWCTGSPTACGSRGSGSLSTGEARTANPGREMWQKRQIGPFLACEQFATNKTKWNKKNPSWWKRSFSVRAGESRSLRGAVSVSASVCLCVWRLDYLC